MALLPNTGGAWHSASAGDTHAFVPGPSPRGRAHVPRDRAATIVESVPLPIVIVDEALALDSANAAFYAQFGLDEEGAAGMSILDLEQGGDAGELRDRLIGVLRTGEPVSDFEFTCELPRLGRRTMLLAAQPLPDERGERSLLLVFEDVTELRRRDERRVRGQSERAQRFLNEAGRLLLAEPLESRHTFEKLAHMIVPRLGELCIIDAVDDDRHIRTIAAHAEPAPASLHERLRQRIPPHADGTVGLVARTGLSVIHPELDEAGFRQLEPARAELMRAMKARSFLCVALHGRRGVVGALTLARASGEPFGLEDLAVAEGLGQRAGLVMENALLYRAAHDAVRLREEFLGIAAHELRTPLTALKLQLEGLGTLLAGAELAQGERVQHKLERALVHGDRLHRLIDSLLVVSRIMRGVLALQPEIVDLSELVREVVERLRSEAARAGCRLEVDAPRPAFGRWDPARLEQVITNLISNALRYAAGAPVRVSVIPGEHSVQLKVQDGGPGVPEERRQRIFERFEIAGERQSSGLGLGLYITRQIAEAHGGSARIESAPGAGATFVVELPRDHFEAPLPEPAGRIRV